MDYNYNFNDAQSLLGSLDSNHDEFQLTSNNLYQNEGFWSNNDNQNLKPANNNKVHIKQEYVSPESLAQRNYPPSSSTSDDQLLNEIINFDDESKPYFQESDDFDSQIDELIQSSTQVPTPESSAASAIPSPEQVTPAKIKPTIAPTVSTVSSANKVTKPKKSRSSHNLIEKKYRTNINSKILELRDAVPALRIAADSNNNSTTIDDLEGLTPAAKLNKASILTKATEYIKHLENKNENLTNEVFQLRHILSQFQQMLPQVPNAAFPSIPQHSPQQAQSSSQHSSPQLLQLQPHQQQQQQQPQPQHPQQQQQQSQQVLPQQQAMPQPIHSHSQQSFTDQVNMGLNGFVPTLHQVQAAQLQLQNLQQNPNQLLQQLQPRSHQSNDGSMSFGNKLLVGGMTTLLGSQMFAGGDVDYDYKGLAFVPIHKLFPALNSEAGQFIFNFMKICLVLFGGFTILEPILFGLLSKFSQDGKQKQQVSSETHSVILVLKSYAQVIAIKLGLKDKTDDLEKIIEFNDSLATSITKCLNDKSTKNYDWKEVLMVFSKIENFAVPETIVEKDATKKTEITSHYIELLFTKLILSKLIAVKIGSMFSNAIGLNKTIDATMLKIIKFLRLIDTQKLTNENVLKISNLINTETDFIDSVNLYNKLCDCFHLGKESLIRAIFVNEINSISAPQPVCVSDLVTHSEDLSIINLVVAIRCKEIFDNNLIKFTKLSVKNNQSDIDSSDSSSSSSSSEENGDQDDDSTDTEYETREEINNSIYQEITSFEKLIPKNSFNLIKSFKFFKLLLKANLESLNEIVDIIKTEACDLIDYGNMMEEEEEEVTVKGDAKISKIMKYSTHKSQVGQQHLSTVSSSLISEENYLLLTCSFILYYHSINKIDECIKLNKFLKINHDLSLLSFIALFETSNLLIRELLQKEDDIIKSMNSVTENKEEEDEEDEEDDASSSSTINLNYKSNLESKLKTIDYNKSNIEQLILKSRLLISQSSLPYSEFNKLSLNLKSDVSDKLIKMGKRINGYD